MSNLALIRDTRCLHDEDEMTKISPSNEWGQKKCWRNAGTLLSGHVGVCQMKGSTSKTTDTPFSVLCTSHIRANLVQAYGYRYTECRQRATIEWPQRLSSPVQGRSGLI